MNNNDYDKTIYETSKINLNKSEPINLKNHSNNYSNNNYNDDYYYIDATYKSLSREVFINNVSEAIVYFTGGMLIAFPIFTFLAIAFPWFIFSIVGLIFVYTWISSGSIKRALIVLGVIIVILLLGFISISGYRALLT